MKVIENSLKDGIGNSEINQTHFSGISEILPTLYLCGAGAITSKTLENLSIKFVVNAAPELPNTPLPDNKPLYLRVDILDRMDLDLKRYFDEVADMIEEVRLSSESGISLVHCVAGVSRSASLVIAYLMKHKKMTLREAYFHVKLARPQIRPNSGFCNQLMAYEEELYGVSSVKMVFYHSLGREIPDIYENEYKPMEEFYKRQLRVKKVA